MKIILVTDSGSDISRQEAEKAGIHIVPMHVSFGDIVKDDGSFDVEDIIEYYRITGKVPKTSGSNPNQFAETFDHIHRKYPDAQILYIAYSAVTTCSYSSAAIAAEERDYVHLLDAKQVSGGLGSCVLKLASMIDHHPEWDIEHVKKKAEAVTESAHMSFIPSNLDFLRAGGRVSNAAALCGNILQIHPCINVENGLLLAGRKFRGSLIRVIPLFMKDIAERYKLNREELWMGYTPGFTAELKMLSEKAAKELGFKTLRWLLCKGVITSHGGPGAMYVSGFDRCWCES